MPVLVGSVLCLLLAAAPSAPPEHAVILLYHHVATGTPPATSTAPDDFVAHLDWLRDNGFTIRPLPEVVAALRGPATLPDKTVALTFDDGYRSVHSRAFPILRERNLPFTVFVCPEAIDARRGPVVDWEQLREMAAAGGTVANHGLTHRHLQRRRPGEDTPAWRQRVRSELEAARARILAEVGTVPDLLAYPYGEHDGELRALVTELGWTGFGQQSGAAGAGSDFAVLPRFPVAGPYAAPDRFAEKALSLPLPLNGCEPESPLLAGNDPQARRPELRLVLDPAAGDWSGVAAFATGQGPIEAVWEDAAQGRLLVRAPAPLAPGRSRYNVTAPSAWPGRWYWYSHLWIVGEEHED